MPSNTQMYWSADNGGGSVPCGGEGGSDGPDAKTVADSNIVNKINIFFKLNLIYIMINLSTNAL